MSDKILCPWYGAEMVRDGEALVRSDEVAVWMRCISCGASSPLIKGPQTLNLEKLYDMAHATARRRYIPPAKKPSRPVPLKPMTLEESEYKWNLIYLEKKGEDELILGDMCGSAEDDLICFVRDDPYAPIPGEDLDKDEYGKTWRYWETMPTDEERSAAEWEK